MSDNNILNTNTNHASPSQLLHKLRESAEQHLDRAQEALYDDNVSDEEALSHLDAALDCVKEMLPDAQNALANLKEAS